MPTLRLADRALALRPSPTLQITALANSLRAQGEDVLSFAAGEPDFNTPEPICEAAIDAIRRGVTKYTPSAGMPKLRQAIADKLIRENRLPATAEQVIVSCGAKHSLYNTMQVLLNPGDEVLLIAPYWMTYAEQVRLAGGVPIVVPTDAAADFIPAADAIRERITSRTRMIVINSPSNPSGAVYPRAVLKEIAALALRHDLWIVSDEIYERLIYGVETESIAALSADVAARTITVGGVAKTYSMTGWRIGFAYAPAPVATAMSHFQDQVTSNPTSFAQVGAIAAYEMDSAAVEAMRSTFEARRDLIVARLNAIPGVSVRAPRGAFYVLPDFSAFLGGDDAALALRLMHDAKIAAIPGHVFEAPGHLRFSYATDSETIARGMDRLAEILPALQ
ncbi:MAG: pyridoxal phosphate-dependent aminotransferase [Fimbriimonadaceae bacterium]|nr:pyridoxal phosphate-dependent aminotransferase [Fimbriimonadaceae bacterium]